jgi:hypothetical protein
MFKKIMLAALIVGTAAFAQINAKFGANAAFNFGTTWGENSDKLHNSWGPGFVGGLSAKIPINGSLSFVTGLGYEYRKVPSDFLNEGLIDLIKKAAKQEYGRDYSTDEVRHELGCRENRDDCILDMLAMIDVSFAFKYLTVPLIVRYNVNPVFFLEGGLSLAFNLNAEFDMAYEDQSNNIVFQSDCKNAVELGAVLGLGFSLMPHLDFNLRFDLGLTDMIEGRKALASVFSTMGEDSEIFSLYLEPDYGIKSMRIQVGLTLWFN